MILVEANTKLAGVNTKLKGRITDAVELNDKADESI
jgi:hypothetical protein